MEIHISGRGTGKKAAGTTRYTLLVWLATALVKPHLNYVADYFEHEGIE